MLLPKISIITPTLNQAQFIEETILSVLTQRYPNFDYIVIDGGSTDGTLDLLKKYQNHLNWISEKDHGQVEAINKGIKLSTGDIIAYINSDDLYLPDTLIKIGQFFAENDQANIISGKCLNIDIEGNETRPWITRYKNFWLQLNNDNFLKITNYISQPATFWRSELIKSIGVFNPEYRYAMDYDYWLRISQKHKVYTINEYLAKFRIYPTSITSSNSKKQFQEELNIAKKYAGPVYLLLHKLHAKLAYALYNNLINKRVNENHY